MSLINYLVRKHHLTHGQAQARARKIFDARREAAAKKHIRLQKAQLTLGLDSLDPGEEPTDRFQVVDPTVDF